MKNLGFLSKAQLYTELKASKLLVYPGAAGPFAEFREISWIGAMEAMACGCVPVAAAKGAIPETVGGAGILLGDEETDAMSESYLDQFARTVVELVNDEEKWRERSQACIERAAGLTWDAVAEQWEQLFLDAYRQRHVAAARTS